MNFGMRYRVSTLADAEAIASLINLAFRVERFFIDSDRITTAEVRERFATGCFLLAETGESLVGSVYVELRGERAYIGLLAVDPSKQRTGAGSRLMSEAEEYARQSGCRFADIAVVNLRVELPPLYRRLGYVETGTGPFPADVVTKLECHFITMTKTLRG
jgi:predicted N-acetyltransferase YhbS